MRKFFPFALVALLALTLAGCFGGGLMELTYKAAPAPALTPQTVHLNVVDQRGMQDLVGPSAHAKELYPELYGGRFDLVTELPNGSKVTLTNVDAKTAVYEAVARRLALAGVEASREAAQDRVTLTVNIKQMNIDLVDGDLVATVNLLSEASKYAGSASGHNTGAESRRMKLVGGTGGSAILSEALSTALNDLDFGIISKEQNAAPRTQQYAPVIYPGN